MRLHTPTHRRTAQGFSIVELMVSIGIIGLLIGISFPFISAMTTGSRVEAGLNITGMSADVARQWVQAEAWANDGSTTAPTNESYSGTAAIYCPTGEIRIVKNDRLAQASSGTPTYLEDRSPEVNGYTDLAQVDYIRIPVDVGIVGIERTGPLAANVRFIAPPFAIAFNELGQLSYGDANGDIYYDADGNGRYNTSQGRTTSYDPRDWGDDRDAASDYTSGLSLKLPFEAVECVPGIVVFDLEKYEAAGFDFDGGSVTLASNEGQWLQDNGQTIFFSPHTGAALREEQE